jgi:thiol:disulfide interchange protein
MRFKFNWRSFLGLVLTVAAVVSYFALFSRWPVTRDIPWLTFLLLAVALWLLVSGIRRAPRKIIPSVQLALGIILMAFFTFYVTSISRQMPAATGAPAIGAKAPDFTLVDTAGRPVSLSSTLAAPGTKAVLLVFYRGFW